MMGGPTSFDFRIPRAELFEIFSEKEPTKADLFEQIIDKEEVTCRKHSKNLEDMLQQRMEVTVHGGENQQWQLGGNFVFFN